MASQPEQTAPSNLSTITGLSHVSLSVSDLKASIAFYTEAAFLEVDHSMRLGNSLAETASGFDNAPLDRAVLAGPNGYLELSQYDSLLAGTAEEIPVRGLGITHICFQAACPGTTVFSVGFFIGFRIIEPHPNAKPVASYHGLTSQLKQPRTSVNVVSTFNRDSDQITYLMNFQ